jgi:anaerobic magnesium-protoporphyrin IX monomethyl ester cyclase
MPQIDRNRILLVHPLGYRAEDAGHDISRIANIMPPLGLASIAAFLEASGVRTDIIDCYARPAQSEALIREYLTTHRPAFIGFSCATANFLDGHRLGLMAKSIVPGIKVVFGGAHVSALKERVLNEFAGADFEIGRAHV